MIVVYCLFFFFNDTATTEIYTLSLHDALPISLGKDPSANGGGEYVTTESLDNVLQRAERSEEHTSELQSQSNLVCRLLLEKKKNYTTTLNSGQITLPSVELVSHILPISVPADT